MKKFIVKKGQEVECAFCNTSLEAGNTFFCKTEDSKPLHPIICEVCFKVAYSMTKDVIEERIIRRAGS